MNSILNRTRIYYLIFFFGIVTFFNNAFGQKYYEIYPLAPVEVQNKMNENKINQVNILDGIYSHHKITTSTPLSSNVEVTLEPLKENPEIISIELKGDSQTFYIICNSTFTTNEILEFFKESGLTIIHKEVEYSTKAN